MGERYSNRAGRRSGGERPIAIPVARVGAVGGDLGPFCAMGRHAMCSGDCTCDCHVIVLSCRKCDLNLTVPREDHDYPEAVLMKLDCPDCWNGDFDDPDYFDVRGKPVQYDPDEIPAHRAAMDASHG